MLEHERRLNLAITGVSRSAEGPSGDLLSEPRTRRDAPFKFAPYGLTTLGKSRALFCGLIRNLGIRPQSKRILLRLIPKWTEESKGKRGTTNALYLDHGSGFI